MSDLPAPAFSDDDFATGFMCLVDFEYEVGNAMGGNVVHPSVEDLKKNRKCWESCGIVEVQIRASRVVHEGTDP